MRQRAKDESVMKWVALIMVVFAISVGISKITKSMMESKIEEKAISAGLEQCYVDPSNMENKIWVKSCVEYMKYLDMNRKRRNTGGGQQ